MHAPTSATIVTVTAQLGKPAAAATTNAATAPRSSSVPDALPERDDASDATAPFENRVRLGHYHASHPTRTNSAARRLGRSVTEQ